MCRIRVVISIALVMVFLALIGCGGGNSVIRPAPRTEPLLASDLQQTLRELEALPAPAGVDAATFTSLKTGLRKLLIERGRAKFTSAAPGSTRSKVTDLTAAPDGASGRFHWSYRNEGDFNQDGVVNVADLAPLGIHYGKNSASPDWATAQVADGNGDGQVGLADLVSIGANFLNRVTRYSLQRSATSDPGGTWTQVADVTPASSSVPFGELRQYDFLLGSPQAGYYRVVPCDGVLTGAPSAPPVPMIFGWWERQTLASPGGMDSYNYPQIAIVGGRPAVALLHSFPPDADTWPDGWYALDYYAANDAQATSWSRHGDAVKNANRPVQLVDLLEVNGAPALCYAGEDTQMGYVRAADAAGSSWGAPLILAPDAQGTFDASMALVNGKPAIAYSGVSAGGNQLGYMQANDTNGSSWPAHRWIANFVTGQVDMRLVDGRPAIAYYDYNKDCVQVAKSSDPDGAPGSWTYLVQGIFGSGGYAELGELSGHLVVGMQSNDAASGLLAMVWAAADAHGSAPWDYTYIDTVAPAGYYFSFGGPCLDHGGVCCYQCQVTDPGLWLKYLDWNGWEIVTSAVEFVDGNAGVGYNCEMTVCEGAPMIVYEDQINHSVKFAVLR